MPLRLAQLAALADLLVSSAACSHALLVRATPAVSGAVASPPAEVAITFSESVEPAFSSTAVQDAAGARVDAGVPQTAEGNARRFVLGLKPLSLRTYSVTWKATSTDTQKTRGQFSFTIQP